MNQLDLLQNDNSGHHGWRAPAVEVVSVQAEGYRDDTVAGGRRLRSRVEK